jgi:AraC-like DNA-binding protein
MHHLVPIRPEWVEATAQAGQIGAGAPLDVHRDLWEAVADLVSNIPPPSGQVEQMLARHITQRAAWEVLRAQVARGLKNRAVAHDEFHQVVTIVERTEWSLIPMRLRHAKDSRGRQVLAISIRDYIDSHYTEKIRLRELALALAASQRRITGEFNAAFGVTVHEYVTRRRLAEAIRLLVTTDVKVSAIAASVGFCEPTALFRQFSRVLGASPRAVRRGGERTLSGFMTRLHPGLTQPSSPSWGGALRRRGTTSLPLRSFSLPTKPIDLPESPTLFPIEPVRTVRKSIASHRA